MPCWRVGEFADGLPEGGALVGAALEPAGGGERAEELNVNNNKVRDLTPARARPPQFRALCC